MRSARPDPFTPAERAAIMRAVKSRDTGPERAVRSLVHGLGFRYSLARDDLPGRPDIACVSRRKAIFVHGCFWHGHACKRGARAPRANAAYWSAKIARNVARDARTLEALAKVGWSALVIWECELKDAAALSHRVRAFLS